MENRGIETTTLTGTAAESSVTITVVDGALVSIGKNRIGLADFLELFFRIRIVGIAVRMKLQRELTVGALEFDLRNRAGHAQHFVVIAFCVRRQNKTFLQQPISGQAGAG